MILPLVWPYFGQVKYTPIVQRKPSLHGWQPGDGFASPTRMETELDRLWDLRSDDAQAVATEKKIEA